MNDKNSPMKKLLFIPLLMFFACDRVKEDIFPSVSVQPVVYTEAGGQGVISLYGAFGRDGLQIVSSSGQTEQIGDLPYLIFDAQGTPITDQLIELEILNGQQVIGNATLEVKTVREEDCINAAFSDSYVVQAGDSLGVNLLDNDAFCDFVDPGTRGIREIPIANFDSVKLHVGPDEAILSYKSPPGFKGTVKFVYELCFGFDYNIWSPEGNPLEDCQYYYAGLATIEVI